MSRFSVILAFICTALAGIAFIPLLPVKLEPSYTLPRLSVSYNMPNNSSRVIEMEVTSRLEAMLSRIKGIREIRSTSGNGWGRISLEIDKHADIDVVRFEASTIIRQSWPAMPDGMTYPVLEMSRPDDEESRPFMSYTINAATTPILIQRFAENNVKPRLAGIAGIYRVDITGATPMEWQLEYDSRQIAALGITIDDIRRAIALNYSREFLGIAQADEGGDFIRLALAPESGSEGFDPSLISVTAANGTVVRLDRLLKVSRREESPTGYYRINGLNSIYLSIRAEESANQLDLASRVNEEMEVIRASLPAGYEMHISYDATRFIREELEKIFIRTILTVIILLLFILVMTRNLRYLALIVSSLAINICISFIFYYMLGLEMQLYSLAGMTISLSLIIDNTIVMSDHIRKRHNRDAFLPILTATLTTIGALSVVFFLDEQIRINLRDFAVVVIVNLAVSLAVALFFIPAMQRPVVPGASSRRGRRLPAQVRRAIRRLPVYSGYAYISQMRFFIRWRKSLCSLLILAFGLPVFMLPEKINMKADQTYSHLDSLLISRYNQTLGSTAYKEKIRPVVDKALGGALRLFVQKVYEGSYMTRREEMALIVTASMPNGVTLPQMNNLIGRMESYLSAYTGEIRQFQTSIFNARQARIDIFFTKESERSAFPYTLKSNIISKALELGGGSWSVYGLPDQGFNNDVRESAGNYRIEVLGYNYDELYRHAETLRDSLLNYRRINEVLISYEFSYYKDDYREFSFNLDKRRLAEKNILPVELFASLRPVFARDVPVGSIVVDNESERLRLGSRQSSEYDVWSLLYVPELSAAPYKISELAEVGKELMPQNVAKIDQQYRLCLQYEYIGASNQGNRIQERVVEAFNASLPPGYSARVDNRGFYYWTSKDNRQYLLLLIIVVIIYFTAGILFNSLRQPLAIIFVIPISYIGVFLTFYWFKLNFDQGGFASFVILCGITINASIYILNEYNKVRERRPLMPPYRAYLKAWNAKIGPIFLTIVSSILGFLPFMVGGGRREAFWFPLAAGVIGGLLMSLAGIFLYLPVFTIRRREVR
ncbi:MAG: efflux RND transporter permease subunit [Tannerellaceae bacterium]|jgi:multidrug efflux pump subunit AcrB|nr:efflux RND transporter permease subunit [Tannerellaceae bacterium]